MNFYFSCFVCLYSCDWFIDGVLFYVLSFKFDNVSINIVNLYNELFYSKLCCNNDEVVVLMRLFKNNSAFVEIQSNAVEFSIVFSVKMLRGSREPTINNIVSIF